MQDILVAVLSLLSTLYWLLVTLKIKIKSHYQVYEALLALASSIPLHCLSSGHLHRTSNRPKEFYLRTLQLLFLPPGMLVSV